MKPVTIAEASEKLLELFDAALRGEEVIITKGDKPKGMASLRTSVKLVPNTTTKPRPKFGSAKGLIKMSDDFDEPLEDFKDYM
ncbi:type II toxin-antitoxin system Phd/YefM family antitoxin [Myxosarcina sp. GI1(2024)]